MTCPDARAQFSARVDDALAPAERAALEAHLGECPECRREWERFSATVALLHRVAPARAPAGFVDRVLAATRPRPWYRRLGAILFVPLGVKLPLEAGAIVLVGVTVALLYRQTPELERAARLEPPPTAVAPGPPGAPAERAAESKAEETTSTLRADAERPRATPAAPGKPAEAAQWVRTAKPAETGKKEAGRELEAGGAAPAPARGPSESRARAFDKRDADAPAQEGARAEAFRDTGRPAAEPDIPAARRQAPATALGAMSGQDVSGRLAVAEPLAVGYALTETVARLGGRASMNRGAGAMTVLQVTIPRDRYPLFVRELTAAGRWTVEQEAAELPSTVRVLVRIGN